MCGTDYAEYITNESIPIVVRAHVWMIVIISLLSTGFPLCELNWLFNSKIRSIIYRMQFGTKGGEVISFSIDKSSWKPLWKRVT